MEAIDVEPRLCPCYKEHQDFQKVMELEDSGLVVYCHRTREDNTRQDEAVESTVNTSRDVFILQNKKDVRITTSQLTSELEKKNISCPRCRKTFEHAQELMQELKLIDKKIVIGICDHCRKRAHSSAIPFCACDKIVKLFKSIKDEQTEDTKKYVKKRPPKIERLRKDKPKQKEVGTYSDSQIKLSLDSAVAGHDPEVQQMFYADAYFDPDDIVTSESDSKGYRKQSVTFVLPNKPIKTSYISAVDSDITSIETNDREFLKPCIKIHKQEKIFEDSPSVDAKEELKRRHDVSLRQMLELEKYSKSPLSTSKRPDVYETPKLAPWMQEKEETLKGRSVEQEKKPEQHVAKSKSVPIASVGKKMKPHFSFLFLKEEEKKESQLNLEISSTILIKDTQEKLRLQAEKLRKIKEEERLRKIELERKKKLAREAKQLEEEKKRQDAQKRLEEEKKFAEEQPRLAELDKIKELASRKEAERKVSKKDMKSKSVPMKDRRSERFDDKSKHEDKDKGVEGEEKSETEEEEKLQTEGVEKLQTEKEKLFKSEKDLIKSKKGESDRKLQKDKQERIRFKPSKTSRDQNMQVGKTKIKKELTTTMSTKMQNLERSLSSIDESSIKENQEITGKKKGGKHTTKDDLSKDRQGIKEFQRLQAQYSKDKEEALVKKRKLDLEAQRAKQEMEAIKLKQEAERKAIEKRMKLPKRIKIKQPKKIRPSDIDPEVIKVHKFNHVKSGQQSPACPVCLDSDLEIDVLSLDYKTNFKKEKQTNIIIGEKIYKTNISRLNKIKKPENVPILFQKDFNIEPESDIPLKENVKKIAQKESEKKKKSLRNDLKNNTEQPEFEVGKGIIHYALSDRTFIDKGWTMLPTEKIVRKMNVYRMRPAHPEFDWFEHNKYKRLMTYDTGERLAEFDDNGRGRWYYRSGRLALDYYDAEEANAKQRFVVYSSGEPDERGRTHPITILATFDYLGNGIVLDHAGKIRLKYNQTEGVVLDRSIGPVSHWKWHTLNDPPVLQQVMVDTHMAKKDPDILKLGSSEVHPTPPHNEEMLAIEFDNFIKDKTKKLSQTFKPFQIKMKALKINEHFSLKVLDQATVYLIFRDGSTNLKVNMGMILDDKEIVDTDTSIVGEVSNSLERFPARTDSLAGLQRSVAYAQSYEKKHAERERRLLRVAEPCASADLLHAAASPPMRLPLRALPTGSTTNTRCSSSKPSNNLYYDTRFLY
ncbi:hypothetical protein PYW08_007122 [Mythimna loreyi]|uniref:Uncharacterized protein n=1 Tax=Mythimna loreyi TaxID=667449 RepID=A0ACC2R979_9NEOP|nr:hypothetical protein PYW08_007122 [Mythimna loreyi]